MPAQMQTHDAAAEVSSPAPFRDQQRPARRPARRILRLLGLSSRKEFDHLRAEHARLSRELVKIRQLLAERDAQPVPAPDAARLARMVNMLRGQLDRSHAEITFRTQHWHRAVAGDAAAASPDRFGFDALHLNQPEPRPEGPYFEKLYSDRFGVSGLEAQRACWLELSCLRRLQSLGGPAANHFPIPVALDAEQPRLTMTHQGWSLDVVPAHLRAEIAAKLRPDIARQAAAITEALERARVIHLDLHATGRNMAITADGHVSLIDFDIAVFDDRVISAAIAQRLRRWQAADRYRGTVDLITAQLTRFCADARQQDAAANA